MINAEKTHYCFGGVGEIARNILRRGIDELVDNVASDRKVVNGCV